MRKPDELTLFNTLRSARRGKEHGDGPWPNDVSSAIGMHDNRLYTVLEKWESKGWWECGVSLRTGWFTDTAPEALTP